MECIQTKKVQTRTLQYPEQLCVILLYHINTLCRLENRKLEFNLLTWEIFIYILYICINIMDVCDSNKWFIEVSHNLQACKAPEDFSLNGIHTVIPH